MAKHSLTKSKFLETGGLGPTPTTLFPIGIAEYKLSINANAFGSATGLA